MLYRYYIFLLTNPFPNLICQLISFYKKMAQTSQAISTGKCGKIHSVVVLNISDHWTRHRVQGGVQKTVCGALLGKQTGRVIEIWNTFEMAATPVEVDGSQSLLLDDEFFVQRSLLYKETFADLEFLGLYLSADHEGTSPEDIHLLRQVLPHNPSPFLLKFNAATPVVSDKLALSLFDSCADPANESGLLFQSIPVKITSELSEQIGLDHVARYSKTSAATESTASKQMGAQLGAINTFIQGMNIAHDYVKAVQAGQVERDEAVLREIHKLCLKLSIHSAQPREESEGDVLQTSDHKLIVLLSAICSVQGNMFQLIENVNLLSRDQLHRERSSMQFPSSMLAGARVPHCLGGAHFPRFFL